MGLKFSVIIPVYNAEKYLAECVESILRQSWQEMEILLIDDGSTDGSGKLCDQYAAKHPEKVKVMHTENQGQLMARTCGIQNAAGDVLLFVDSDDCLRFDALDLLQCQFDETKCDMVLFNASQDADYSTAYLDFGFTDGQRFCGKQKELLYEMLITTSKLNSLCFKAVKKSIAEMMNDAYKQLNIKNAEDLLYSMPLLSAAKTVVYLDQNLYYYRSRPGSIVHSYNPKRHLSIKKVHTEMEKYINWWGMQTYHGKHYAREVRGWVECLKLMLNSNGGMDDSLVRQLAEDAYFRNAYILMERGVLSAKDALLAGWLYKQQYRLIRLAGQGARLLRCIKQRMKGNEST